MGCARLPGALVLVALLNLAARQSTDAACVIRLQLDTQGSKIVLSSNNELINGAVRFPSPATFEDTVPRGFTGALYAVSQAQPTCPDPADPTAWLASWPSFILTSVSPSTTYNQPISVYPVLNLGKTIAAGAGSAPKYDYNVSNLRTTLDLGDFTAISGQAGTFRGSVSTQLVDGTLASYSFITNKRVDSLQGLNANQSAVAVSVDVKTVGGRSTLVLDVPSLQLTYQTVGNLNLSGVTWKSLANLTLTSQLRATAALGCPTYCGDYGRCDAINGTAECVCDCGWSKGSSQQCDLPWGYCDASGVLASAPLASSVCIGNTTVQSVQPSNGTCPTGYDWDTSRVNCNACPSGFSGHGCLECMSDTACRTRLSSSAAQCSTSTLYQPRSTGKQYTCNVLNPDVAFFVGTVIHFNCSTTKPDSANPALTKLAVGAGQVYNNDPVNSTPYCQLSFRSSDMPRDAAVECTGWACRFTALSSQVYCPVVKCGCPRGCAGGILSEATFTNLRTDVKLACGAEAGKSSETATDGTNSCRIELSGLPIPAISLGCTVAECLDPVNGKVLLGTEEAEASAHLATAPIIAFMPSMALLLLASAAVAAVATFIKWAGPGPVGHNAYGTAASAAAPAGPVAEGVEMRVPLGQTGAQREDSRSGSGGVGRSTAALNDVAAVVAPLDNLPHPSPPPPPPQQQQSQPPPRHPPTQNNGQGPLQQDRSAYATSRDPGSYSGGASGEATCSGKGCVMAGSDHASRAMGASGVHPGVKFLGVEPGYTTPYMGQVMVQVLSWHELHLSTRPRRAALRPWRIRPAITLLRDVSGRAVSGELLGIMGPSGSGKTTLLSVLAGLIQPGLHWNMDGIVRLDGRAVASPQHLAALVGHVPQHDPPQRWLTVSECVATSGALKLSWGELRRGRSHLQARVASVLRELGISYLADRMLLSGASSGSGGSTLSGGERLRASIAMELVSDPPMLLLDEPLSGLDSAAARTTMAVLRDVATGGNGGGSGSGGGSGGSNGRVVITSLHQPSPALFAALDSLLLMASGQVAAAGSPSSLAAVLAAAAVPAPPPDVHIAEHLLDLVVCDPVQAMRLCEWHSANKGEDPFPSQSAPPGVAPKDEDTEYIRSLVRERGGGFGAGVWLRRLWLELGVVAWRSGLDMLRNPSMLALHLAVTGTLGLLVGAVFSDTDLNVSGAQNRLGAIFFAVMLLACFATSAVDGLYPERPAVDRDMLRRSYGVLPYILVKLVLDGVLLRALPAWAFGLPFYWLMGLRKQAVAFFTFMGAFTTMSCLSGAACIALSCIFSSPGRTVLLFNLLLLICALFSGFLANKDSIVVWLRWIVYLSPIRFCWEALVINELKPLVLSFSSPDLPQGLPAVKGSLFLSLLGVNSNLLNTYLIVLGCMYAILALAATSFAALRLVVLRGRWN